MTEIKERVVFSWSGGKDSALALHELRNEARYEIATLLTTLSEGDRKVPMHEVDEKLLKRQAESLGLPLQTVYIPESSGNEEYEFRMHNALDKYKDLGINKVVHADLFLEDVRQYRENNLNKIGFQGLYPIWGRNPKSVAKSFVNSGFKAIITCIDTSRLDQEFVGKMYDHRFLSRLPEDVDPCGEHGEFHTFVFDGPGFRHEIPIIKGDTYSKFAGRFIQQDLKV